MMHWPWVHEPPSVMRLVEIEAPRTAVLISQQELEAARKRRAEAERVADSLREIRERNHFGEQIDAAMQRRQKRDDG